MMFDYNKQQNHLSKINNNKIFDAAATKLIRKLRNKISKINLKLFAIFINNKTR